MNKKTAKILALVLSVATLLALAIGISVSADAEPTLDILSKNMSYGSNFKVAFAVDNTGVAENQTLEVLLYAEDPAVNPDTQAYKAELAKNTVYQDKYPVFFSYGIPAKDLTAYVWAQAHIVGTDIYGEVYRYSAIEYFCERLYTEASNVTPEQAKLYNTCLTYCADAQAVISTKSPKIGDVNYVYVSDGTLDGVNYSALLAKDATFTPAYSGTVEAGKRLVWEISALDEEGNETKTTALAGEPITVSGRVTVCEAAFIEGPVYAGVAGTGEYYNNATGSKFTCNAIAKGTSYSDADLRSGAATTVLYNNEYVQLNKGTATGRAFFQYNNTASKPTDAENLVMVTEADFAFGGVSVADGNNPNNPYVIGFYFDGLYCALFLDVNTDGKVVLNNGHYVYNKGLALDADTWYNLRFEIYDLTENGFANEATLTAKSALIRIYVNGVCYADAYAMDAAKKTNSNRMNVMVQDVNTGVNEGAYVCLDNVYLGYDNKAYTELLPDGVASLSGTHNGGAYYNGDYDGVRSTCSVAPTFSDTVMAESFVSVEDFTYVYRTESAGHAYAYPVKLEYPTDGTTPATIIELDYAVGNNAKATYTSVLIYRYGDKQVSIYFGVADGKIYLQNGLAAGENISLDIDTWHNLRFEIYGLDTIKVFVDGVWACDIKGLDTSKTSSNNYLNVALQGTGGAVSGYHAYDNVYIGFTDKTYVAGNPAN